MKYLKISNEGLLDIESLFIIGGSTKKDKTHLIGQFGTGLKYAISYLIRNNVDFKLFIGKQLINFYTKPVTIREVTFNQIYCNDRSLSITTDYGYQWKAWEAIREIWCNALDEENPSNKIVDGRSKIEGEDNKTIFYIAAQNEEVSNVIKDWNSYFMANASPIFENDNVAIYYNNVADCPMKLYKNNVLIKVSNYQSVFHYDLKNANLNELRQYQGFLDQDIGTALLNSNSKVIDKVLECFSNSNKKVFETSLDYDYASGFTKKEIQKLFQGYLFLHPDSSIDSTSKKVKVSKSLFTVLQRNELPTEKVSKTYGRAYSSSYGISVDKNESFKEVRNDELQDNIDFILKKYKTTLDYKIGVGLNDDSFEILTGQQTVFNSSLEILSLTDLECIVLIALINKRDLNLYKVIKRLIKFSFKNKNFKQLLFTN